MYFVVHLSNEPDFRANLGTAGDSSSAASLDAARGRVGRLSFEASGIENHMELRRRSTSKEQQQTFSFTTCTCITTQEIYS